MEGNMEGKIEESRLEPFSLPLGKKAVELLKQLAGENEMAAKYFYTKIIIREARSEAAGLTADRLKERLRLIDEANDELIELINNPPKNELQDREYSTNPKRIYQRLWEAHRRLKKRGVSEAAIHDYCLTRFGMDISPKKTPSKNPKLNPEWVGGGRVAAKIKQARKISVQLMDTEQKPNRPLDTEDTVSEERAGGVE